MKEVIGCQKQGYFDEHLSTLYSTVYGEPYLFDDKYLIYNDRRSRAVWLTLFALDAVEDHLIDKENCFRASVEAFLPENVVLASPETLPPKMSNYHCEAVFQDRDYQINLEEFNEHLSGESYKRLRYRVNHAKRQGYCLNIGSTVTPAHLHVMAVHLMKKRDYRFWDCQLYLGLSEYVRRFSSPRLFNVLLDGRLVAFDVVDVLDETMVTPLGFYLNHSSLADFLIYEEILCAKKQGFEWLDIGWACNSPGLEGFKRKWKAIPRFVIYIQTYSKQYKSARVKKD